jgi:glycogen debranching enzyme
MRGLLLITGRFEEARILILAYGGCLRHGLVPNLLGSGASARYNCRDAVWFWLQCIKDYCSMCPDHTKILSDYVVRLYPTDDADMTTNVDQQLHEVIQEAMQRHADGVTFREHNAGSAIDNDMSDAGFDNRIGVDWETGFVFGGNEHNCGTWMDKMGSSSKAGNRGKPATPRDGSAIELVGLCASVTRWLGELHERNEYPHKGVKRDSKGDSVTYKQWANLICANFEKYFWIDPLKLSDKIRPDLINRRGIYKDSVSATMPWTDYQLRPNFPIALAVAPEMCDPEHMWTALEMVQKVLLGPLGMKTLDPSDFNYNGFYINSDDSADYKRAKGFNYHQGPEWVWPIGFFLRAKLLAASQLESKHSGIFASTVQFVHHTLSTHHQHVFYSDWKGLPELTNQNGAYCADSCEAQAWSAGCVLEVLYDMELLLTKK